MLPSSLRHTGKKGERGQGRERDTKRGDREPAGQHARPGTRDESPGGRRGKQDTPTHPETRRDDERDRELGEGGQEPHTGAHVRPRGGVGGGWLVTWRRDGDTADRTRPGGVWSAYHRACGTTEN
jgi:hypothetical protein